MESIFINIPSYKDPDLWNTINNFISNAEFPDRVFFGITNQSENPELAHDNLKKYNNIIMDIIPAGSIVGCQPARLNSHRFYNNQDYYLNMDSHMRSCKNWDSEIIRQYKIDKEEYGPLVFTGYAASYHVDENGNDVFSTHEGMPTFFMSKENQESFYNNGVPQFQGIHKGHKHSVLSPYVSGHFFFTEKHVIKTVPFMDKITFTEEEPLMALRFFTAGFNLLTPSKNFVYHRYGRDGRPLFWEDFPEVWGVESEKSKNHFLNVVHNNIVDEKYGLFDKKTVRDFELYAGINFKNKYLSERLINGDQPVRRFAN